MKRTVIAVVLAVAALALLASLVLQSRSVPAAMHVAHTAILAELARAEDDYGTLRSTLVAAWDGMQPPGDSVRTLTDRLAESPRRLTQPLAELAAGASRQPRIDEALARFRVTAAGAADLAGELLAEHTAHIESVAFLRESGATIVQHLRDSQLDDTAAAAFQLVVGTLDYATPAGMTEPEALQRLRTTMAHDERMTANMRDEQDRLIGAVDVILRARPRMESGLEALASIPLRSAAANLATAVDAFHVGRVAATDQARLMLSVYAVLLLWAAALGGYRLQQSYRDLNRANTELEALNQSLEERVAERTRELAGTLEDLKESQVQLVQAEKMSSLGQLVAGISHEINTPLLYLANNAVLIQERLELARDFARRCAGALSLRPDAFADRASYQTKLVEELRTLKKALREQEIEANLLEAQELAKDSIEGLAELTDMAQSLKDFSRLDRAPVGSFDVNAGLDKTLLIAKNIVKHKADVRKSYGELPEIQCSPSKINQVFLNLITNAAQAMEEKGEIVITTRLHDADHVAVSIEDTGCGIPEEHLRKIRDPFFTTKEVGSGTGLGLSIVDEIVRSHGGELQVKSQVGQGSVFTVILPIRQEHADDREDTDMHEDGVDRMLGRAEALAEAV